MKHLKYFVIIIIYCGKLNAQEPTLFLKELLSNKVEYSLTITPDKKTIYFVKTDSFYVSKPKFIYKSIKLNDKWSVPKKVHFSGNYSDSSPFVTPNGKRLFFASKRPVNGKPAKSNNIWYVNIDKGKESEPIFLKEVNSEKSDYSPSTDKNGNLFFGSYREGGFGSGDLWWSEYKNGKYQKPKNLGSNINSKYGEWGSCISVNGNFLIFENSGKPNNLSAAGDLYISIKLNEQWQTPIHFKGKINSIGSDLTPKIHNDTFYFASNRPINGIANWNNVDIYSLPISYILEMINDNISCNLKFKIGNGLTFLLNSDEIFISKPTGIKDAYNKNQYRIFKLSFNDDGTYSEINFDTSNTKNSDYHPVISPNGKYLAFNSTRPKPNKIKDNGKVDIYLSKYKNGMFSKPQYLKNINSEYHDSYPSFTNTNKLYFNSNRPGGKGLMDIYVSEYKNGKWQHPDLVPELNSEHSENDLVVDPDERFIILNRYISKTKEIDLFISYNKNGKWSKPISLDIINKKNVWELTPTLSLNGKTLYIEVNGRIKCYDIAKIIKNEKQ